MNFVWPTLIIILVLLAAFLFSVAIPGKYGKMFADDHLLEVWTRMGQAKRAALDAVNQGASSDSQIASPETPQHFTTSAGVTFVYTIDQRQGGYYHHHISMSHRRLMAMAAATYFTALLGEIFTIDVGRAMLQTSRRMIHHLTFTLDEASQAQFASTAVIVPDASMLVEVRQRVLAIRPQVRLERVAL